jgi:hypothetical protein
MFHEDYIEPTSSDKDFLICDDRFSVPRKFYQTVIEALNKMKVHLLEGNAYTPPELLGYELWFEWGSMERNLAILVLIHLVDSTDEDTLGLYFNERSLHKFVVNSTF